MRKIAVFLTSKQIDIICRIISDRDRGYWKELTANEKRMLTRVSDELVEAQLIADGVEPSINLTYPPNIR